MSGSLVSIITPLINAKIKQVKYAALYVGSALFFFKKKSLFETSTLNDC
jgi:hypothetical protein